MCVRLQGGTVAKRISVRQCEQFPNGTEAGLPSLFRCGASLISSRFLLTAAHCLRERPVFARLGVLELQPARTVDEPLDIAIRQATPHPDYHAVTYQNDIALLELAEPVTGDWHTQAKQMVMA